MFRFFYMISILFVITAFFISCEKISIERKIPEDAVIAQEVIFIDEVEEGEPQTVQFPGGKVLTYKMPPELKDGQIVKIKEIEGEPPYYIKFKLKKRPEKHENKE